jgi:glycine/sarcosine/betaine reductase complex component A
MKRIEEILPQKRKGAKFGKLVNGGQMQKGKKIIAIGERDGVPGPVIAECLEGAGYEVVFQVTECFV